MHTMAELKLTGNHLKGSRPILTFTSVFDEHPHLQVLKELLLQVCAGYFNRSFLEFFVIVSSLHACTPSVSRPSTAHISSGLLRVLSDHLQVYCTPKDHRKSKPFFDHVFAFSVVDNHIWFRNYQVGPTPLPFQSLFLQSMRPVPPVSPWH